MVQEGEDGVRIRQRLWWWEEGEGYFLILWSIRYEQQEEGFYKFKVCFLFRLVFFRLFGLFVLCIYFMNDVLFLWC